MHRKLTCPKSAHLEEIEYTEDPTDGAILGVISCSAFEPRDVVTCNQECIHRLNRRLATLTRSREGGVVIE